jgi:hypothetical protein
MRLLSYILWTQEIIFSMDKKKEMIVLIIFLGKELSMRPLVMTRNIYSFMNRGVCVNTESFTKICLQFWMNSVYVHLEKRQVSLPNRFCKHFGLHDDERIHAYLIKLSNNTNSDSGFSHERVTNSQSDTICSGIT